MKTLILIAVLAISAGCGESEVNLAWADDAEPYAGSISSNDSPSDSPSGPPADSRADSTDESNTTDSTDVISEPEVLVTLDGEELQEAFAGGEISFTASSSFEALNITWNGDASLTLVTDSPREVKPDFAQRGAFDAIVELAQPTSSASLRADPAALTYLRIAAVPRSSSPTGDNP